MPIYEYACTACGERTEARQSFEEPPLTECPICGGALRKLYSPVGVVFKGSGFYSTDAKKKPTSTSDAKPSGDGKASTTGEKKTETKKEPAASTSPAPKKTEKSA